MLVYADNRSPATKKAPRRRVKKPAYMMPSSVPMTATRMYSPAPYHRPGTEAYRSLGTC